MFCNEPDLLAFVGISLSDRERSSGDGHWNAMSAIVSSPLTPRVLHEAPAAQAQTALSARDVIARKA
jgi:hypothetical protein